jgi:hypothetical protein
MGDAAVNSMRGVLREELRLVRRKGIASLDRQNRQGEQEVLTPYLDQAIEALGQNLPTVPRSATMIVFLAAEIDKIQNEVQKDWLPISLGVANGYIGEDPEELRRDAAVRVGQSVKSFKTTDRAEWHGMDALAAQIERDCFTSQAQPMNSIPATIDVNQTRRRPSGARKVLLGAAAAAAVAIAAVIIVNLNTNDSPGHAPGTRPQASSPTGTSSEAQYADEKTKPVAVDSVRYLRDGSGTTGGGSYVFPTKYVPSAAELAGLNSTPGDYDAIAAWMLQRGGVNPYDASLQLNLRGSGKQTAVITNISIAKHCTDPLYGTLFYSPPAGPSNAEHIAFDLDKESPVATNGGNGPYFSGPNAKTIQLAPGEPVTILLDVNSFKHYCEFTLRLTINPGGGAKPIEEDVRYGRTPFSVTGLPNYPPDYVPMFERYPAVYAGGVVSPTGNAKFGAVDPTTFKGY